MLVIPLTLLKYTKCNKNGTILQNLPGFSTKKNYVFLQYQNR